MSHTPGPWQLRIGDGIIGADGVGYVKVVETNEEVAVLYGDDQRKCDDGRLIAAAPDLLDALKKLLTALASENFVNRQVQDAEAVANTVILKAEGLMTETLDIRRVWPDVTKRGDPYAVIVVRRPGQFQPFTLTTFSAWMIALCERAREKAKPLTLTWRSSADGKYKDLIDAEWPQ